MRSTFRYLACWAVAVSLAVLALSFPAARAQPASGEDKTIVFACMVW
jgi:hypothetical protein